MAFVSCRAVWLNGSSPAGGLNDFRTYRFPTLGIAADNQHETPILFIGNIKVWEERYNAKSE